MSSIDANPLVGIRFPIPFDRIGATDVVPAVRYLIAEARGRLRELADRSGPRTFDNTMLALDRLT